jgi:hypothetical protein
VRRDLTQTQGCARFDWPCVLTEAVALEANREVWREHDVLSGYEGHVTWLEELVRNEMGEQDWAELKACYNEIKMGEETEVEVPKWH